MEIGPIFRALINHRSRFWLITLEIALTLAIVTNCFNMIVDQRSEMIRPTGIAVEELLVVSSEPWSEAFHDEEYQESSFDADLRALQEIPGVRRAIGTSAIPLSGGGSSTGLVVEGSELDPSSVPYYFVTEGALETYGLNMVAGRGFTAEDYSAEEERDAEDEAAREAAEAAGVELERRARTRPVVMTQALADHFYPDGNALGNFVGSPRGNGDSFQIVGIVERMHCSWPQSSVAEHVMMIPGKAFGARSSEYMVRVESGSLESVMHAIEPALLAADPGRIVRVKPLDEIKDEFYSGTTAVIKLLGILAVLLIVVTTLGIVGLTSFSVTQRSREIGTRRALGATKLAILRYFLIENWLMTAVGLGFGLITTFALNFVLSHFADVAKMDLRFVFGGMLLLWVAGQLAALLPALKGMSVAPVVATRNVY